MLQLENQSPFAAQLAIFPDANGIDSLIVAVKATFHLRSKIEVAPEPRPIQLADEYWGEPGKSSLKYASEMHLAKPFTDVVMVGQAWAPKEKPVAQLEVSLSIGSRRHVVRVIGDREWRPGFWFFPARATAPAPFRSMPLTYERAFGGLHELEGRQQQVMFEPRNPIGRGFAGKRRGGALRGLPLPNLEDPARPVKDPKQCPVPTGFGYIPPAWEPRKSYAGTYDAAWQKTRAPFLPKDFDARFFNAAHPGLVMGGYLEGGEPVEVMNASSNGPLRFRLPRAALTCDVTIAARSESAPLLLETVLLEPDDARLSMLWRATLPCDKQALRIEKVRIALERLETNGSAHP